MENIPFSKFQSVLKERLTDSLSKLQTTYVDTLLFHTSSTAFDHEKLSALYEFKKSGLVAHCGISVYHPEEAFSAIQSGFIDFIQLPFNLFDHRFYKENIFNLAKEKNIIIHSRSVFLQGLFAMNAEKLPPYLKEAKAPLAKLEQICQNNSLSKLETAMAFVKSFPEINKIVIGVNNLQQLKNNLIIYQKNISQELIQTLLTEFNNLNKKIYLPTLWK